MRPWIIAIAVIVLGLVVRVAMGGFGALNRAQAAESAGDLRVAVLGYREALAWYLPVAPWRGEAANSLLRLAKESVVAAKWDEAVMRLNMFRSGVLGGRSILGVDDERLATGDALLSAALAQWEIQAAVAEKRKVPGTVAERTKHYAEVLARDPMPSRGWGLLAVLGFFLWLGGAWWAADAQPGRKMYAWLSSGLGLAGFLAGVGLA